MCSVQFWLQILTCYQVELDSLQNRAVEIASRLVRRREDTEMTVKNEIKHFRESVLRHLEDYIIQHNQQHVIELDANLTAQELFRVRQFTVCHAFIKLYIVVWLLDVVYVCHHIPSKNFIIVTVLGLASSPDCTGCSSHSSPLQTSSSRGGRRGR